MKLLIVYYNLKYHLPDDGRREWGTSEHMNLLWNAVCSGDRVRLTFYPLKLCRIIGDISDLELIIPIILGFRE